MTTDYTKPPLAPKPRLICHASLKLPSPLMSRAFSAARGPKPPIAPKPKVLHNFNGRDPVDLNTQEDCINGSLLPSDEELDQENEAEDSLNKTIHAKSPVERQFGIYSLSSGQRQLQIGSWGQEEYSIQKTEDWKSSDSGLTEEAHSLEAMGVSDAGFTSDSPGATEKMNTDMSEDTDAEACDGGEALADADGLSVGDLSVISTEEDEAGCCSYEQVPRREDSETREEGKIQNEEAESTADVSADSLTEEPVVVPCENKNTRQESFLGGEEAEERSPDFTDCGITCNATVMCTSHESKEKARGLKTYPVNDEQHTHISSIIPGQEKWLLNTDDGHLCLEVAPPLEPYYISSEDIIETLLGPTDDKSHELPENEQGYSLTTLCEYEAISEEESVDNAQIECMSSEDYVDIGNDMEKDSSDKNAKRPCQKRSGQSEEGQADTAEALLVHSSSQLRLRLVSVSVPREAHTFLTYSRSESQLLSPNDSDVFRDDEDLEGHIIPFLDDTTDTEQDLSDEHVYEEAGHDSEGENILPFDRRAMVMRSRSLSGKVPYYVTPRERGSQVNFQKLCLGGFGQMGPAMSSSPLLNMPRSKSYSRPLGLSTYTRSFSMEGRDTPLGVYRGRERGDDYVISSSGSLSQRSPLPSSGLSTPTSVMDIPPPFELAYITKRPITKSSPSLLIETDSHEKNKKKDKSSFKRFLMLKFRRKTGSKPAVDVSPSSCRSPSDPGLHAPSRLAASDRRSTRESPQLDGHSAGKPLAAPESPSVFLFYKDGKRKGGSIAFLNRSIGRVESFEDRSRVSFTPLPLTKPRSISFPNANISDYENIPAISSDYENVQVPHQRPVQQGSFIEFFDHPTRGLSSAHETDGYVDMSSFPGFESKTEQEPESAYTEAYTVCSVAASAVGEAGKESAGEEEQGRTSEEEEGGIENTYDKQPDGRSRAFYIAKELVDTERLHVKALKLLQEDFREAVGAAVGDEGDPVLDEERLREILNELPDVYSLHRKILTELENRIRNWEENQRIADVILARKSEFLVFTTYIGHYDRSMNLLDESCRMSPAFATIVRQFEQQSPAGENISLKHQLLQVVVRVAQYRMLLTDYLNNLSPDSKEYEDTQAAVVTVSGIADQANDSLKHGENLLRLVNIEYSVRGQRGLLQPGRVFIKEGTLMKVSRKSRQPRHLFLTMGLRAGFPVRMFLNVDFLSQGFIDSTGKMNDVLLYTYPQQDGKYRLKNTLSLTGMKVSKPVMDNVQNGLKIDATDISITLSASSCNEREDWFYSLSRTVADHTRGPAVFNSCPAEARERLWLSLGEKAPTLVPVSHVMMCMSCNSDFGLTLRRHHCHACGRIVCRSCCRNRYPLKYMRDRMAKVCDHCYNQLKKKGGDVSALTAKNSPRLNRSSRPLSAVFQNIHPPTLWRHRKGNASLTQVTVSDEGSISGNLQRSKRSKKNWKRLWFLLKDKVLYTYRAREEQVASESLPLLGFTVRHPDGQRGTEETTEFQLYHKKTLYYTFKAEDNYTAQRWVNAMEEATVL